MKQYKPAYFDQFSCLAGDCPDSCCQLWEVAVDDKSADSYRSLPGQLGQDLRKALRQEDGLNLMTIVQGRCPMWQLDGLCRIQAQLGEQALCQTCREFPRLTHDYGDFIERGLELSCPEAARLILSASPEPYSQEEVPGLGDAEYDSQDMALLLATREQARQLLANPAYPPQQRLAQLLLYGCQVQGALDGGELGAFSPEDALETALLSQKSGDIEAFLQTFRELEILTDAWREKLDSPAPGPWDSRTPALARYFVDRYWLQAVSDFDLYSRVKFICIACLLVKTLGGAFLRTAQLLSKEIENDADNMDALLDGAYTNPAFTDDKLLGMLLEE